MRFEALSIEEHILDKIESKHGVTYDEAEEAFLNPARHLRRTRFGLYSMYSQTAAGRYLLIVVAPEDDEVWRLVTARDLEEAERRLYQRRRGR